VYDDSLYGTAECEMNAYSAVCIIITAVNKPTIKMNCPEKNIVYTSVFGKTMPIV
jgi:hypothetical protein